MNDHRISRRSFLAAAGMAGAAAALTACGGAASSAASSVASSEAAQSVELIVFAAASLTETLNAIGESYTAEHPEVTFRFNFDSSGTLKTQIQEGADCDLFISAGQKQMNQLDITASADGEIGEFGRKYSKLSLSNLILNGSSLMPVIAKYIPMRRALREVMRP